MGARRFLGVAVVALAGLAVTPGRQAAFPTYTVVAGDSLWGISQRHGVTVDALARANGLGARSVIVPGQVLTVPRSVPRAVDPTAAPSVSPPPAAPAGSHVVAPGEGLWAIAQRYGIGFEALLAANGLRRDSLIHPGQVLAVPGRQAATPAPATPPPATPVTTTPLTTAPVTATRPPLPVPGVPAGFARLPSEVRGAEFVRLIPLFQQAAAEAGIPADLLMAVAFQESRWRQGAISPDGAVGIGQLMPGTASWVATTLLGNPALDPRQASDNVRMSARYLRWLADLMRGDLRRAVGGYFQGPYGVLATGLSPSARRYADQVLARRSAFLP
jgi:LysM repeat protein